MARNPPPPEFRGIPYAHGVNTNTAEEEVRRELASILLDRFRCNPLLMEFETAFHGGRTQYADIAVFDGPSRAPGSVLLVAECKARGLSSAGLVKAAGQCQSYMAACPRSVGVVYAGEHEVRVYGQRRAPSGGFEPYEIGNSLDALSGLLVPVPLTPAEEARVTLNRALPKGGRGAGRIETIEEARTVLEGLRSDSDGRKRRPR